MTERPGEREDQGGPIETAFATSIRENSIAFGFSIMITASFAALQRVDGQPTIFELLIFGLGAATAVGVLAGIISRGFRRRLGISPPEVRMLGTAQNVLSVAAGVGAALLIAELLGGPLAWVLGGTMAATTYLVAESVEILIAEEIQKMRGDPDAERPQE